MVPVNRDAWVRARETVHTDTDIRVGAEARFRDWGRRTIYIDSGCFSNRATVKFKKIVIQTSLMTHVVIHKQISSIGLFHLAKDVDMKVEYKEMIYLYFI
jgi:hypothetical protein